MEAIIARGVQVLLALGGAYLIALWFVLVVWSFRDIETRSKSVLTQIFSTLLVVLFFIPGVLLYLILRPKETLDSTFQRSLEEEYLLQDLEELPVCRSCQHYIEDDFMLCPNCQSQLREPCVACARLVDLRWTLCPYCGTEQTRTSDEQVAKAPEPAVRWIAPTVLRRRVVKHIPGATPTPLPVPIERETAAAFVAMNADQSSPPPVRLFDRRKTREAARANAYRRVSSVNGELNGHGAPLVDQFGRVLDPQEVTGLVIANEGFVPFPNQNGNGNGHAGEEVSVPRMAVSSEDTGD